MFPMTITAAADGSALGNPGPAGWAWYISDDCWAAGGWPHGTNNMGELKAVLDLLESTSVDSDQHLLILCDSQYVINSVTKWMPGWKKKGWKKKDGKPVLNKDLLQGIDRALAGRDVEFQWVKGHAGHAMNEAADRRANGAATAFSKCQDPDVGPGYRGAGGGRSGAAASGTARSARPGSAPATRSGSAVRDEPSSASSAPAPAEDLFSFFDEPEQESGDRGRDRGRRPDASAGGAAPSAALDDVAAHELLLLRDDVRRDRGRVAALLHPEFTEIGASGRSYDRAQMLEVIAPIPAGVQVHDMITDQIAPGVVLLRYTTTSADGSRTLRSSVWVREGERWLARHHQGTPAR
jgi:ribonuclease HI